MKLLLLAVGQRIPGWAEEAVTDYARRFPADSRLLVTAVKAASRQGGRTAEQCMATEAERLLAACPKGALRVVLDEQGSRCTTTQLSQRLRGWRTAGRDVVFFIGGPDGLAPGLAATADETLRLSDLTLPHALARVLLVEALYRAHTVLAGHPYHRE
jgi:23S rRNA (pseudouridine1915-N3)-methyltransferase